LFEFNKNSNFYTENGGGCQVRGVIRVRGVTRLPQLPDGSKGR
jgi:hypothetical protein